MRLRAGGSSHTSLVSASEFSHRKKPVGGANDHESLKRKSLAPQAPHSKLNSKHSYRRPEAVAEDLNCFADTSFYPVPNGLRLGPKATPTETKELSRDYDRSRHSAIKRKRS